MALDENGNVIPGTEGDEGDNNNATDPSLLEPDGGDGADKVVTGDNTPSPTFLTPEATVAGQLETLLSY